MKNLLFIFVILASVPAQAAKFHSVPKAKGQLGGFQTAFKRICEAVVEDGRDQLCEVRALQIDSKKAGEPLRNTAKQILLSDVHLDYADPRIVRTDPDAWVDGIWTVSRASGFEHRHDGDYSLE